MFLFLHSTATVVNKDVYNNHCHRLRRGNNKSREKRMIQGAHLTVEVLNSSIDAGYWKDDMDGWN